MFGSSGFSEFGFSGSGFSGSVTSLSPLSISTSNEYIKLYSDELIPNSSPAILNDNWSIKNKSFSSNSPKLSAGIKLTVYFFAS